MWIIIVNAVCWACSERTASSLDNKAIEWISVFSKIVIQANLLIVLLMITLLTIVQLYI